MMSRKRLEAIERYVDHGAYLDDPEGAAAELRMMVRDLVKEVRAQKDVIRRLNAPKAYK